MPIALQIACPLGILVEEKDCTEGLVLLKGSNQQMLGTASPPEICDVGKQMKKWHTTALVLGLLGAWVGVMALALWCGPRILMHFSHFKGDPMKCTMGLVIIAEAKQGYEREHPESVDATVGLEYLQSYVGLPNIAVCTNCPSGGIVRVERIGKLPTCSIREHQKVFDEYYSLTREGGNTNKRANH